MASGTSFNRRLAGNTLKKATGLDFAAGVVAPEYAYIQLPLHLVYHDKDVLVLAPTDVEVNQRVFLDVSGDVARIGPHSSQLIYERGDVVRVVVHNPREVDFEELDLFCRIYVAR